MRDRPDALVIESMEFSDRQAFDVWMKQVRAAANILWSPPKRVKNEKDPKALKRAVDAPARLHPANALRRDLPPLQD
jgi:hypothetical protein